jgi:hypothetical protein
MNNNFTNNGNSKSDSVSSYSVPSTVLSVYMLVHLISWQPYMVGYYYNSYFTYDKTEENW